MQTVGNLFGENAKKRQQDTFVKLLSPALHSFSQADDGKFNSKVKEASRVLELIEDKT